VRVSGITHDTRPDPNKKSEDRNPARDPLARMEKALRLHCINLQMGVSIFVRIVFFNDFLMFNTVFKCVFKGVFEIIFGQF
jgi:hypothetical protein